MIKSGQIYNDNSLGIIVINYIHTHDDGQDYPLKCHLTIRSGENFTSSLADLEEDIEKGKMKLISEYSNWIEAINSKEFKGE